VPRAGAVSGKWSKHALVTTYGPGVLAPRNGALCRADPLGLHGSVYARPRASEPGSAVARFYDAGPPSHSLGCVERGRVVLAVSFHTGHYQRSGGMSVNEYEASLIIKSGAELLLTVSSDPRSDEGYAAVKDNLSEALEKIAEALVNFEAGLGVPSRSTGWVQDLRRVADDLVEGSAPNGAGGAE